MKRILSFVLCLLALMAYAAPAAAAKKSSKQAAPEPAAPVVLPLYTVVDGVIKNFSKTSKTIEIEKSDGAGSIVLQFQDALRIVDNERREIFGQSKIKAGLRVRAWHSTIQTRSNPPRAAGYAVVTNIQDGALLPEYFEVEWVGRSGSTYKLLNQPKTAYLDVGTGCAIKAFNQNAQSKISAMRPGAQFLYWPDEQEEAQTAGISQFTAKTIVMFPYSYEGYMIMEKGYINVNGYMLAGKTFSREEDGVLFIPIIEAAQRMDFASVTYNKNDMTATLKKAGGKQTLYFTAEQGTYRMNKTGSFTCIPPVVVEGSLYIALETFLQVGAFKVVENT